MSAVTLAQHEGTNGSLWDLPSKPKPAVCRSSHPHPQSPSGRAVCRVDHAEQGTEVHGAPVGAAWFTWTTRAAATAWSAVDTCTYSYCPQIVPAGQAYCSTWCSLQDKHADEHDQAEEVGA